MLRKCAFNLARQYATKGYIPNSTKLDPGVRKRAKLLSQQGEEIEDLDQFESDFMQLEQSHKAHGAEIVAQNERLKYLIVRQRHFQEKYPNFLTWHDKEQIRYLHRTNPEEWTLEKLSESFPALPEVIAKIIKGSWTKSSQNRITNHDLAVQNNWKQFKEKQLNLPEELVDHLSKFTSRSLIFQKFVPPETKEVVTSEKKNGSTEFSDIIKMVENLSSTNEESRSLPSTTEITNSSPTGKKFGKKTPITLAQYQKELENDLKKGKTLSEEDTYMVKQKANSVATSKHEPIEVDLVPKKFETKEVAVQTNKPTKDYSHLIYPERIRIPLKVRSKGQLFKLNDCYYDKDGEFLYRVPGMCD